MNNINNFKILGINKHYDNFNVELDSISIEFLINHLKEIILNMDKFDDVENLCFTISNMEEMYTKSQIPKNYSEVKYEDGLIREDDLDKLRIKKDFHLNYKNTNYDILYIDGFNKVKVKDEYGEIKEFNISNIITSLNPKSSSYDLNFNLLCSTFKNFKLPLGFIDEINKDTKYNINGILGRTPPTIMYQDLYIEELNFIKTEFNDVIEFNKFGIKWIKQEENNLRIIYDEKFDLSNIFKDELSSYEYLIRKEEI